MSKVKLKMSLPETLSDIPLWKYQDYLKILEQNKNEEGELEEGTEEFLNLKSLQIFCGLELKDSYGLPVKTFMFALEHLQNCFSEKTPHIKTWMMRDSEGVEQEMGFIPRLDDMSYGEYVDLDKYMTDWQQMHKAMAVLYRPIRIRRTRKNEGWILAEYEGTEMYADAMKEMPVNIVIGAVVFFYRLGMKLSENMIPFLEKNQETLSQHRETSDQDGDGIPASMSYLREILEDSMRYQNFHFIK